MARALILVNGLPGSGKSTLAVKLAALLGCPVLSKDAVKESFADLTGETVPGSTLGGLAMDAVWQIAAAIVDGVVIDSFWLSGRDDDFIRRGVATTGADRVVEVWCEVPLELARKRFDERRRHPIHTGWVDQLNTAQPIGIWPVVGVDTSRAVDMDALLPELAAHLLG
jgi:predicted kinase